MMSVSVDLLSTVCLYAYVGLFFAKSSPQDGKDAA